MGYKPVSRDDFILLVPWPPRLESAPPLASLLDTDGLEQLPPSRVSALELDDPSYPPSDPELLEEFLDDDDEEDDDESSKVSLDRLSFFLEVLVVTTALLPFIAVGSNGGDGDDEADFLPSAAAIPRLLLLGALALTLTLASTTDEAELVDVVSADDKGGCSSCLFLAWER